MGDAALQALVSAHPEWERLFRSVDVPEDVIPRLMRARPLPPAIPTNTGAGDAAAPPEAAAAGTEDEARWGPRAALGRAVQGVASRVPPLPVIPSYFNIGRRFVLLPSAILPRPQPNGDGTADDNESRWHWAAAAQNRFLLHKMRSYRARFAHIVHAATPHPPPPSPTTSATPALPRPIQPLPAAYFRQSEIQ